MNVSSIIERKDGPPPGAEVKAAIENLTKTVTDGLKALGARVDDVEALAARPRRGGQSDDPKALSAEDVTRERKAIGAYVRSGDETELKAMSVGTNPDGGYTVTPVLSQAMTRKLWDQSPVRRLARMETITVGDAFEELIDPDESGAMWVDERQGRPATATPGLKKLRVQVREIYSLQPVTQRLLDDSEWDIGAWLEGKISDKFGRAEGVAYVSGDGVLRPTGFLSYPVVSTDDATRDWGKLQYVPMGGASDFASSNPTDNIKNLYWALRAPYRANATWLMNSATANKVDKFKDGQGNYIWRNGMTAGAPDSLLNRPVEICEDMPAVAANSFPIAFGDFKQGYLIVEKPGIKMLRDPYTDKPNVLFYAYRRVGGGLANSEAIKLGKIATS